MKGGNTVKRGQCGRKRKKSTDKGKIEVKGSNICKMGIQVKSFEVYDGGVEVVWFSERYIDPCPIMHASLGPSASRSPPR